MIAATTEHVVEYLGDERSALGEWIMDQIASAASDEEILCLRREARRWCRTRDGWLPHQHWQLIAYGVLSQHLTALDVRLIDEMLTAVPSTDWERSVDPTPPVVPFVETRYFSTIAEFHDHVAEWAHRWVMADTRVERDPITPPMLHCSFLIRRINYDARHYDGWHASEPDVVFGVEYSDVWHHIWRAELDWIDALDERDEILPMPDFDADWEWRGATSGDRQ